jgi:hypothetical protein
MADGCLGFGHSDSLVAEWRAVGRIGERLFEAYWTAEVAVDKVQLSFGQVGHSTAFGAE